MSTLPEPESDARAHSFRVLQHIRCRLSAGPLPFSEYMRLALYAPGLGYYMAGARRFGTQGDFITAPEVSSLFARCLACQCAEILDTTGGAILEFGAGSGALAAGILHALQGRPDLDYRILEPSAALRQQQRERLLDQLGASVLQRVTWLDTLPEHFNGVMLANEVMDAIPVERFRIEAGEVQALHVALASGGTPDAPLTDRYQAAPESLEAAVRHVESTLSHALPEDYRSEVNLQLPGWIHTLAEALDRGVILLIDYGYPRAEYYLPERCDGTFACYFQHHQLDDPYRYPGLQDLTAHVDFTRAAEVALDAGMDLLGYTSQAAMLLSLGLLAWAETEQELCSSERQAVQIARAVKTLTLPGEMGERFQAIAFGKGYDLALSGFTGQDLSHRL